MRLIWAFGVESRQAAVVLPCLQSCFEDLRALTGGSRPPILRLHSDKASEFLTPTIRAYLSQQGVRQTVNSGYDPQGNGLAERWIGIVKVRATALLADVRLPPDYWSYACRWVAYVHTHRVTEIPINKALPHFGDVVVMHHAFKKPPSFENRGTTGVCLGHDSRIAGGVLVVSVVNGELKEVCSAKVRTLGEKVGQAWRLHVHPQDSSKAAYVNRKGEVKWSLHEIEVPTVEQCVKEDALEVQDIRELGLGWAWFMNDLRAFLPAWQEMELASPSSEEPVTQIEADVPIEPLALQADATHLDLDLHVYERPLAVTPFGTPEAVPDWQDTHAMHTLIGNPSLGKWIRTDLGVRTFQGLGKNSPAREQVVQRITRDLHTKHILEDLPCDSHLQVPLHRKCLPACGPTTCHTRDIETTFVYRLLPRLCGPNVPYMDSLPSRFPSGGGGGSASFSKLDTSVRSTLGTRTLSLTRQFIEDAEKDSEKETGTGVSELNVKDTKSDCRDDVSCQEGPRTLDKDAIKALRMLFEDFEDHCSIKMKCLTEARVKKKMKNLLKRRLSILLPFFHVMRKVMSFSHVESHSSICVMIGFNQWQ